MWLPGALPVLMVPSFLPPFTFFFLFPSISLSFLLICHCTHFMLHHTDDRQQRSVCWERVNLLTTMHNGLLTLLRGSNLLLRSWIFFLSHGLFFLTIFFYWCGAAVDKHWYGALYSVSGVKKTAAWVMNLSSSLEYIDTSHMLLTYEMNTDCKEET